MTNSAPDNDPKPTETQSLQGEVGGSSDGMAGMSVCMDKFARSFEASARRWELIVYPLLFAFVLLAAYGFFLIYQLTNSVSHITGRMDVIAERMVVISDDMHQVSEDFSSVTGNMNQITGNIGQMTASMQHQDQAITAMSDSVERMTQSMSVMSVSVYEMRYDTRSMGRNLQNTTGPMRFMNTFVPW
ncbi:MAG: hypothetical protein KKA36_04130 [Gammaproteobacteria bacterium]|nr:hypothetical protein [Gammaproteobacteria bacterium]MBU2478255.1 hypothetical protein [Gammaproteobacteria bacterium]